MNKVSTTCLRIDFQVREILPDGRDASEARYVTFGDQVNFGAIKEFFERCGIATDMMFQGGNSAVIMKRACQSINKIPMIKALREITGVGLKCAKDLIEQPIGCPIVAFKDSKDAENMMQVFVRQGVPITDIVIEPCNHEQTCLDWPNVPVYQRPQFNTSP